MPNCIDERYLQGGKIKHLLRKTMHTPGCRVHIASQFTPFPTAPSHETWWRSRYILLMPTYKISVTLELFQMCYIAICVRLALHCWCSPWRVKLTALMFSNLSNILHVSLIPSSLTPYQVSSHLAQSVWRNLHNLLPGGTPHQAIQAGPKLAQTDPKS